MHILRFALIPVAALLLSPGAPLSTQPAAHSHRRAHAPIIIRHRGDSTATSSNWSGYAVTGPSGSVTDARGDWTVPSVTCTSTNQYSSFWVGIDGYDSNTVEQIGTDSDCQNGKPVYYAWYEFYPHFSTGISLPINSGDMMHAEVSFSGGKFTVSITDLSTKGKATFSQKMPSAKMSSAEWIAEAPYSGGVLPLADFGTVNFGLSSATVGKTTGGFGSFNQSNVFAITMDNPDGATAVPTTYLPSGISSNSNFSIQYNPPAP